MTPVNWKNILHTLHNTSYVYSFQSLTELAMRLEYPYILWNDRIYETPKTGFDREGNYAVPKDTGHTVDDLL